MPSQVLEIIGDLSVISDIKPEVAQSRAKMMSAACETICLADSNRLSARALYRTDFVDQVSQVITATSS